jgi:hypothetical protein
MEKASSMIKRVFIGGSDSDSEGNDFYRGGESDGTESFDSGSEYSSGDEAIDTMRDILGDRQYGGDDGQKEEEEEKKSDDDADGKKDIGTEPSANDDDMSGQGTSHADADDDDDDGVPLPAAVGEEVDGQLLNAPNPSANALKQVSPPGDEDLYDYEVDEGEGDEEEKHHAGPHDELTLSEDGDVSPSHGNSDDQSATDEEAEKKEVEENHEDEKKEEEENDKEAKIDEGASGPIPGPTENAGEEQKSIGGGARRRISSPQSMASDSESEDSTIVLSQSSLYYVLSKIFMTDDGVNLAELIGDIAYELKSINVRLGSIEKRMLQQQQFHHTLGSAAPKPKSGRR